MLKKLKRDTRELTGDKSGLTGDCSGLRGDCSGLTGDLDQCDISDLDRRDGIDIEDLIEN